MSKRVRMEFIVADDVVAAAKGTPKELGQLTAFATALVDAMRMSKIPIPRATTRSRAADEDEVEFLATTQEAALERLLGLSPRKFADVLNAVTAAAALRADVTSMPFPPGWM